MNFKVTFILIALLTLFMKVGFCTADKKRAIDKNTDLVMVAQELLQPYRSPLAEDSLNLYIPEWIAQYKGSKEYKTILSYLIIAENHLLSQNSKSHLEKALSYYHKAWNLVENSDLILSKASVRHQIGNALYRMEDYIKGLEYLLRADWMMRYSGYEKFENLGTYLYNLGYAYAYYFEDFENGKYYLDQAVKNNFANPAYRYASYDFLGLLYRQKGDIDSSHQFFQMALREALRYKDSVSYGEIMGNIGFNYFLEQNYEEARRMLQINHQFATRYKNWTSAALSYIVLTKIDIRTGNIAGIGPQIAAAGVLIDSIRKTGTSKALYLAAYNRYENYLAFAKWRQEKDLIIGVQDTLLLYKDSLYTTRAVKTALKVQINLIKESNEAQIRLLKSEEVKKIWVRNFIILLCIVLFIVLALYIYQLRLRSRKEQQEIADYLNKITEKNRLLKQYEYKIEEEQSKVVQVLENAPSVSDLAAHLHLLRSAPIHTEEDWTKFKIAFEKIYPEFFDEISDKIPNISSSELRFLALTKLGISSHQMAQSLGIAMDSVRKLRYRLRKKMEHNLKAANKDFFDFNI